MDKIQKDRINSIRIRYEELRKNIQNTVVNDIERDILEKRARANIQTTCYKSPLSPELELKKLIWFNYILETPIDKTKEEKMIEDIQAAYPLDKNKLLRIKTISKGQLLLLSQNISIFSINEILRYSLPLECYDGERVCNNPIGWKEQDMCEALWSVYEARRTINLFFFYGYTKNTQYIDHMINDYFSNDKIPILDALEFLLENYNHTKIQLQQNDIVDIINKIKANSDQKKLVKKAISCVVPHIKTILKEEYEIECVSKKLIAQGIRAAFGKNREICEIPLPSPSTIESYIPSNTYNNHKCHISKSKLNEIFQTREFKIKLLKKIENDPIINKDINNILRNWIGI